MALRRSARGRQQRRPMERSVRPAGGPRQTLGDRQPGDADQRVEAVDRRQRTGARRGPPPRALPPARSPPAGRATSPRRSAGPGRTRAPPAGRHRSRRARRPGRRRSGPSRDRRRPGTSSRRRRRRSVPVGGVGDRRAVVLGHRRSAGRRGLGSLDRGEPAGQLGLSFDPGALRPLLVELHDLGRRPLHDHVTVVEEQGPVAELGDPLPCRG